MSGVSAIGPEQWCGLRVSTNVKGVELRYKVSAALPPLPGRRLEGLRELMPGIKIFSM